MSEQPVGQAGTPIYLIRHAKAGHDEGWSGSDHLRPLTKPGRRQAEALVDAFAEQPLSRLLSSPYLRCVQTLEPLAEARGLRVESADELVEGGLVEPALELILAVAADGPAVLSTDGDIVQFVLDELEDFGIPLDDPPAFKKGSTWVLEVSGGAFRKRPLPAAAVNHALVLDGDLQRDDDEAENEIERDGEHGPSRAQLL